MNAKEGGFFTTNDKFESVPKLLKVADAKNQASTTSAYSLLTLQQA
jgi:hypothetical protein